MKFIALSLIIMGVFASCSDVKKKKIPAQEITVIKVKKQNVPIYSLFVGQVYGFKDIPIRARVDGYLEGIHFKEGFSVKKGQLLYTIDSQPFEAEVAAQKSKLAEAITLLANAESEYNRYKPLVKTNAVSKSDYDAVYAQFEAAKATVEAAKANLRIAQIKLGYTRIKSPINGIIGKTQAKVGEYVGREPNPVILNTVSRIDNIIVEFFITENQYLKLARYINNLDSAARKNSYRNDSLQLVLSDGSIHKFRGNINFIDRNVDSNTGAMLVQASFPNPNLLVRPGQYAKVKIKEENNNVVAVPQRCVQELQGQYSVFIVNKDNEIETRTVETGNMSGDLWIIKDGINEGDLVVIDALQKVQKGMVVVPKEIEFESKAQSK
jgi:membrane fusion protein (multidrug efflux system)